MVATFAEVLNDEGKQGCCRTESGSGGVYTEIDGAKGGNKCATMCLDAGELCVGYEVSKNGCELHEVELTHVEGTICSCFRKITVPARVVAEDSTTASDSTAKSTTVYAAITDAGAAEVTDSEETPAHLPFVYTKVGQGCCRSTANPTNDPTYFSPFPNVKSSAKCSVLCDNDSTCKGYEINSWQGCELHAIEPDFGSGTNGCKCFSKGAPFGEVAEQPYGTYGGYEDVDAAVDGFARLGSGCCKTATNKAPDWISWMPDYTLEMCAEACAAETGATGPACTGYEFKRQNGGESFTCRLSQSPIAFSNENPRCECYVHM
jgi:hypothetical protein